jgi:hypothetical protein
VVGEDGRAGGQRFEDGDLSLRKGVGRDMIGIEPRGMSGNETWWVEGQKNLLIECLGGSAANGLADTKEAEE